MSLRPFRLQPSCREKIWGATALEPWFRDSATRIGEVWFTFDENRAEDGRALLDIMREHGERFLGSDCRPGEFPILTKFIYTTDRLSIQVHPDERRAQAWEGCHGKTEMWHILRAEPGAEIAVGPREPMTRERLREAAVTGEIEDLLRWLPVQAGDTIFASAGTVHAIGAGLALCEIQQNSDVTYRLYDYGRPRELHLDKAVAVANLEPHPGLSMPAPVADGVLLLACCEYFRTELVCAVRPSSYRPDPGRVHILLFLEGTGALAGRTFSPGDCWLIPASADPFEITPQRAVRYLRTYVPEFGAH